MVSRDVCGYEPTIPQCWTVGDSSGGWFYRGPSPIPPTPGSAGDGPAEGRAGTRAAGGRADGRAGTGGSTGTQPDTGVYATLVLAPADFQPKGAWGVSGGASRDFQPGWLTLAAGVAVHRALSALIGPDAEGALDLKWPNDVLWNGRKVCGILAESEAVDGGIAFVVLGIGINVGQERFPDAIRDRCGFPADDHRHRLFPGATSWPGCWTPSMPPWPRWPRGGPAGSWRSGSVGPPTPAGGGWRPGRRGAPSAASPTALDPDGACGSAPRTGPFTSSTAEIVDWA